MLTGEEVREQIKDCQQAIRLHEDVDLDHWIVNHGDFIARLVDAYHASGWELDDPEDAIKTIDNLLPNRELAYEENTRARALVPLVLSELRRGRMLAARVEELEAELAALRKGGE